MNNFNIRLPGKLFHDMSENFFNGCAMGTAFYFLKGFYFGPTNGRIKSGALMVRERATSFGGNFASWSFVNSFNIFIITKIRNKKDYKNNLLATLGTGVLFSIRNGFKNALKNGLTSFCALTLVEGIVLIGQQYQRKKQYLSENKIVAMYKKEYENKGIKFIPYINLSDMEEHQNNYRVRINNNKV